MTREISEAEIIVEIRRRSPSHVIQRIADHAERYLWLRDKAETAEFGTPFAAVIDGGGVDSLSGDELDAAIDAAMKGGN